MFMPGYYIDHFDDLVIVYPNGTFEYWAAVKDGMFDYFVESKDQAKLELLIEEFISEF